MSESGIPINETSSPIMTPTPTPTSTPTPTPVPLTNVSDMWNNTFSEIGSMGNYPRPQGNLPALQWQLTPTAQKRMNYLYNVDFTGLKS